MFSRKDEHALITLLRYYVLEGRAMRLHGVAWAMREFKRSLRPDTTNPVIIVVPDGLARSQAQGFSLRKTYSQALVDIAKLWVSGFPLDANFCCFT